MKQAWWARHAYFNRYITAPKPVYPLLLSLVKDKDYFVLTTNVDHQFQLAGFDKKRLFYTQGDYGLFQSVDPSNRNTYNNEAWVMQAMEAQGFVRNEEGVFDIPEDRKILMRIPSALIPTCPDDNGPVTMNLRGDDTFVEDGGCEAYCPRQIEDQAICIDDDIGETLRAIRVNPYDHEEQAVQLRKIPEGTGSASSQSLSVTLSSTFLFFFLAHR